MAKNSELVTIDYRSIMAIPPGVRRQMASQGTVDPLLGVLTPGQRVALFPNYFKDNLDRLAGQRSEFGGVPNFKFPSGVTPNSPRTGSTASVDSSVVPQVAATKVKDVTLSGTREKAGKNSEYYDRMYKSLYRAAVEKGVPNPEVIARLGAAQTSIETGYGKHMVGNNAFGIKGEGVTAETEEVINGQRVKIKAGFKSYGSVEESAAGYIDFLQKNKRYAALFSAQSVDEAIAIQATTGYATDPSYGSKLASIHGTMGVNAPNATAIVEETDSATPVTGQGSVMDDTLGIGDGTAVPLGAAEAGGVRMDDTSGSYGALRQGVPEMIGANDPIWNSVDPSLLKNRDGLVDADTGLIGRDALLSADAAAKVLRKNGYIPRPVSGGDNHSANHGRGRQANYSIDMAASIETESGKIENVQAGSGLPYEVKRDMAIAAKLSAEGSGQNFRLGFPLSDSNASMHIQQDPERESTSWGYDSRTASGADASRIILETNPEGQRYLSDIAAIDKLPKEKRDELLANVTGQVSPNAIAQAEVSGIPTISTPNIVNVAQAPESANVATKSMAAGGMIAEPHTAINDRTGERTKIGEKGTGGEFIVPRNKVDAAELGQQPYQMPQSAPQPSHREPTEAVIEKAQPAPRINATGQQAPSNGGVMASHPVAPPSARKAYADAGLEARFNNFSPLGTQYRSFGA